MKTDFVHFLKTIFFKLDEKKVLAGMEKLLADPLKTDEQIYKELLTEIGAMQHTLAPLREIHALGVLRQGMGKQAATLLSPAHKESFQNYMEIYDRRYLGVIRKMAGLPLKGQTIGICNDPTAPLTLKDRVQAGQWIYPYQSSAPLNDPHCTKPFENPHQTHKPIGMQVADNSVDLAVALGGLHHVPPERLDPFVDSLHRKLKPGGMVLFRDHNVTNEELRSMVSVVHSFVNAADQEPWEVESLEVRNFKSMDGWAKFMENHQFTRISPEFLVLKNDPTQNGMALFAKTPQNIEELRAATQMLKNSTRAKNAHAATWIEWGNVRSSKQYAEFIQNHHSYAFDYLGQMRQHWEHAYAYIKFSREEGVSLRELIFSSDFVMNLFILLIPSIQMLAGHIASLPSSLIARIQYGDNWRSVANLTELEKYQAQVEKEYSDFIDHTPSYQFPFLTKVRELWSVLWNSQESTLTKVSSIFRALTWTLELAGKALSLAPARFIFTSEGYVEPDTINVLIKDPLNELQGHKVIYTTPDGHKLVSLPRYRPLTQILGQLSQTSKLEILEIGGQKKVSVDLLLDHLEPTPQIEGAQEVYRMEKLQDPQCRRYVTYQVAVPALKALQTQVGLKKIEYIHE